MKIGKLGKSSIGTYSGLKAEIFAPKSAPIATGDIKGAIFTSGLIELGWVYRDGYTYPKVYYKYYDSEAVTPDFAEVLVSDISFGGSRQFEVRWSGTNIYSEDDLKLFDLYIDNIKIATITNVYDWNNEDFWVGLETAEDDEVGFLIKNIKLYKLDENFYLNDYTEFKYSSENNSYDIDIKISAHDSMFVVSTPNWKDVIY